MKLKWKWYERTNTLKCVECGDGIRPIRWVAMTVLQFFSELGVVEFMGKHEHEGVLLPGGLTVND